MFKSYLRIAWRHLAKNKGYSFINIGGLAIGMTVAIFIGLWIFDEVSFNKYHKNYDQIAQVWGGGIDPQTSDTSGSFALQYPLGAVLKNNYPHYFKHVLMAWWPAEFSLASSDKKFIRKGEFIEESASDMLSLHMISGTYKALNDPHSIILSKSTADAIFGKEDPINKLLKIDNRIDVKVTGVYEDIPRNNRFSEVQFFSSWTLWAMANPWGKGNENDWDNRRINIYVQLQPNVSIEAANEAIKDVYYKNIPADFMAVIEKSKPFAQVIPMSSWHLYSEFKNGKPAAGRITFVWLFGIVGIFVLLLACINFINLSTARSEKRAREVGVRKSIGSDRRQLVIQFLTESFVVVLLAFLVAVMLILTLLHWFNQLADKDIALPFTNPVFWITTLTFITLTGLMAGLYPAFYLSSFQPVKVLKGHLRLGRFAALPRKVLVVVQFTVSVILIIGTLVVYQQIQYARDRPVGYERKGLITVSLNDPDYKGKQDVLKAELLGTGVVAGIATSSTPLTEVWSVTNGYNWMGKDPNLDAEFAICNITPQFGKTVNWKFVAGRDFSSDLPTDSTVSIIINETAARYMGFKDPVGQRLTDVDEFGRHKWTRTIIGVVKDIVMESPYEPVKQTIYYCNQNAFNLLHIRIAPNVSANAALPKIESALAKVAPAAYFDYKFVDDEYARKFSQEQRIGKLSGVFSTLAIIISCLGLFGLASFVAEQRTREIGIRKVLGATVLNLWRMLSKDFVVLVIISCIVAAPVIYYIMTQWLQKYQYRTSISWWVFAIAIGGTLLITLMTVSFQAIRAAVANPVKSLRTE